VQAVGEFIIFADLLSFNHATKEISMYRYSARLRILALLLPIVLGASYSHAQTPKMKPLTVVSPTQTYEGILIVRWADPHPLLGSGGETRYALALADGSILSLQLTAQDGVAQFYFNKRVIVSGRAVAKRATSTSPAVETIEVDTIAPSPMHSAAPNVSASVVGTKKVIFLLVKFQSEAAVPHPPVFYTDLTNPSTPPAGEVFPATINGFFLKTSYNQFSWVGSVGGVGGVGAPGGWLTLPHPKSYYAPCGWTGECANVEALGDDATALGRAQGIVFTDYDNINFVLSNDLDCCAYGGGYFSSVDSKVYGATWEPPWGQETGVYSHEMGHSLGLPHSGWVYYAYDSPWDIMSNRVEASGVTCGSYASVNDGMTNSLRCTEPGDGYIAAHKDYLGWIPVANQVQTDNTPGSGVNVNLEGASLPLSSGLKMIKICLAGFSCTGSSARYLTVEARVKGLGTTSQYDNGIYGEGLIIHNVQMDRPSIGGPCFFNNQSGWAVPIDSTPGDYDSTNCNEGGRTFPNYALYNAQWAPGQTYTNGTTIQVLSRTGSSFNVSVATSGGGATAASFYVLTPCRLIDTRNANGTYGGPSLNAGVTRNFPVIGQCGIPTGVTSLSINVTSVSAASSGWLTLFPGPAGAQLPPVSTVNYASGKTLANNAILRVAADGTINVFNSGPFGVHFIVDVNGYFK
jgi:hypothetical protein